MEVGPMDVSGCIRLLQSSLAAALKRITALEKERPQEASTTAGGVFYAPKSWISDAMGAIMTQGVPINPYNEDIQALLKAPGWCGSRSLSEKDLDLALTHVINRAKLGRDPIALLCSILKRETAEGILAGDPAVIPGQVPRDASNTTTGEGRHSYQPGVATKIRALLGHAAKCKERAEKKGCPEELVRDLEDEANRYVAEAARIGPAQ